MNLGHLGDITLYKHRNVIGLFSVQVLFKIRNSIIQQIFKLSIVFGNLLIVHDAGLRVINGFPRRVDDACLTPCGDDMANFQVK